MALKSIGATKSITALLLTRLYAVFNIFFLLHIASAKIWRLNYFFPETKRTNIYILPLSKMCALPTIRLLNFRVHHTHAVDSLITISSTFLKAFLSSVVWKLRLCLSAWRRKQIQLCVEFNADTTYKRPKKVNLIKIWKHQAKTGFETKSVFHGFCISLRHFHSWKSFFKPSHFFTISRHLRLMHLPKKTRSPIFHATALHQQRQSLLSLRHPFGSLETSVEILDKNVRLMFEQPMFCIVPSADLRLLSHG